MTLDSVLKELSLVEWFAVAFTLANVYLVMRADVRNFAFGIVSAILYADVFWVQKLYMNFWLQVIVFLPLQLVGWYYWLRMGPKRDDDLPIARLSGAQNIAWFGFSVFGTGLAGWLIKKYTDGQQPFIDAFTTVFSITGQILLTKKVLENWVYWIVVDVIYAFWLLPKANLWVSAALYFTLLVMASFGLRDWLRAEKKKAVHA
ncbi:MAG: nicotinamide riboside transporter PnuC [Armatimonadetes bacterium]|nr:nicotinamide riboside transporter PnuC [Armatimonadota bacterium]